MESYYPYNRSYLERRQNQYAVVIFLPDSLDDIIAPFREQFDPVYNLIVSHITLVFPFETNQSLDELSNIMKTETETQEPILIELDSIGDFYPESPVIYWNVKKNEALYNLYYCFYSRLGLSIPFKYFHPHVTVAREISNHRVLIVKDKIVSYLPQEKFYANAVDIITPLVNDRWVSVRTFPLSGSSNNS